VIEGELKLLEAEDAKWLNRGEHDSVQWLLADITLISKVKVVMK
jgi:8-oxo-dGTP diphosphatase